MKRKQIIIAAAVTAAILGTAGCSSASSNQVQSSETQTSTAAPETEETTEQTDAALSETEETTAPDQDSASENETFIADTDTYTRTELHLDNNGTDIYGELYLPKIQKKKYRW